MSSEATRSAKKVLLAGPRWLIEHPVWSMVIEAGLVLAHGLATMTFLANPFTRLVCNEDGARSLYLALGGAGAPLAGFAGVVVVFALGDRKQLAVLRRAGSKTLQRTWVLLFVLPFTALFAGLGAAVVTALGGASVAPFLAEFAVLLLIDTLLRGTWLIGNLIQIVGADDQRSKYDGNVVPTTELGLDDDLE